LLEYGERKDSMVGYKGDKEFQKKGGTEIKL
jgi:hypothetical protein